ncbi:hypothetical protein [Nitrosospira sp. Is2]|uniref:hypothetical protein n=1 Tax=Nitrosospira sp. Is2 TaxID=3080532 RepID=UPI002952C6C4|nr:hypothetical protein [Nitrosospira sp. Is2]WON74163.1 hypothetical protein R5L00_01345 [Nitrosospira sp. Is2]
MDDATIKAFRCALERIGMDEKSTTALLGAFTSTSCDDQSTEELAKGLEVKSQSIHARVSRFGSYYGLRPIKLPNGRLRWPGDSKELLKRQGKKV